MLDGAGNEHSRSAVLARLYLPPEGAKTGVMSIETTMAKLGTQDWRDRAINIYRPHFKVKKKSEATKFILANIVSKVSTASPHSAIYDCRKLTYCRKADSFLRYTRPWFRTA